MKKRNKVIIGIIAIAIAACLGFFAYQTYQKEQKKDKIAISINLEKLKEKIEQNDSFSNNMKVIDQELLLEKFQISLDDVEEYIGQIPIIDVKASMYLVIKAKDGKTNEVKHQLEIFSDHYEEQWSKYLENEFQLVKDKVLSVKGNYVYLIIASNAKEIEKLIQ